MSQLIQIVTQLAANGVALRSLTDAIDTTSAPRHLFLDIMGALAGFERSLIVERTRAGTASARQRGERVGRKPKLSPDQIDYAKRLIDAGESPRNVAKSMGVSTATLYRKLPAAASNRNARDLFTNLETLHDNK